MYECFILLFFYWLFFGSLLLLTATDADADAAAAVAFQTKHNSEILNPDHTHSACRGIDLLVNCELQNNNQLLK